VGEAVEVGVRKAALRRDLRAWRRALTDRGERSERIWSRLVVMDELVSAQRVLAYTSIVGEPETSPFLHWCGRLGKVVAVPEDDIEPTWADIVIVPGLAFTLDGGRLGQGGGWYDRFLPDRRRDCLAVGVCFAEQVVDMLPVEAHDVRVDRVVSDG
jgi:5-formyltetrahydrofolate cyclo-ligase